MREKEKYRICIMTATRAEYGLLRGLIKNLKDMGYDVRVAVTGMHLSSDFGYTIKEIEADGIEIDAKIDTLSACDTEIGISETIAATLTGFARYFSDNKPDLLIVLGDRYETLAVCIAAMNARIPIAHIHGGESTEGLVDECIRHAITKMSYLHFTSCEAYRKRVIQLGEAPERVFNTGALGVDNIIHLKPLSRKQLYEALGLDFSMDSGYAIVTFHPVTLEEKTYHHQIEELLVALREFPEMNFILTKSNADEGGRNINQQLEKFAEKQANAKLFDSLGWFRYLSAMKYALMLIGNSSSGILEAPSFGIPTINIGDRQKGRIQAGSIINCGTDRADIIRAIKKGLSKEYQEKAANAGSPYGNGQAAEKIARTIDGIFLKGTIDLKKAFYDLPES